MSKQFRKCPQSVKIPARSLCYSPWFYVWE